MRPKHAQYIATERIMQLDRMTVTGIEDFEGRTSTLVCITERCCAPSCQHAKWDGKVGCSGITRACRMCPRSCAAGNVNYLSFKDLRLMR